MSFPSWERGLKPPLKPFLFQFLFVVPLVGTWIETYTVPDRYTKGKSFPSWERGLKHQIMSYGIPNNLSFPSWERGLKLVLPAGYNDSSISVVPLVGTWIET